MTTDATSGAGPGAQSGARPGAASGARPGAASGAGTADVMATGATVTDAMAGDAVTTDAKATDESGPLLRVEDLRRHFRRRALFRSGGVVRAVDGVSFTVEAGRAYGLVGESGSGKSTVARCVLGLERPDAGRVVIGGVDTTAAGRRRPKDLPRVVQAVFQNPASSLNPRWSAAECVAEPLSVHGVTGAKARARTAEVLGMVGLTVRLGERRPHELSGGQQQRVALARALALRPRLIVADEPLSALDVSIQAQILNLMLDLKRDTGLSYLFISHDLTVTRHLCETVGVFYRGRIVETGPSSDVLLSPRHPYTASLLAAATDRSVPAVPGAGAEPGTEGSPGAAGGSGTAAGAAGRDAAADASDVSDAASAAGAEAGTESAPDSGDSSDSAVEPGSAVLPGSEFAAGPGAGPGAGVPRVRGVVGGRGCAYAPRCPRVEADCLAAPPVLAELPGGGRAACIHPLAVIPPGGPASAIGRCV